jgi:2-dehydro-3-deoxyphosphogalactonate aldolase
MTDHRQLIAILRGVTTPDIVAICDVLVSAGISLIEVPLNSPDPFTSIKTAASTFVGRADVGAGTVLTVEDAEAVKAAGGVLVVSPDTNEDVIRRTRTLGMASYPGVFTPTDAFRAIRAGATGL